VWLFVPFFYWFARPTSSSLVAGGVIGAAGLALRAWAAAHLRKGRFLTLFGPYAHLRNPLYVGSFLLGFGVVWAGGQPLFLLPLVAYFAWIYPWHVGREEEELSTTFGDAYERYRGAVPAVIPRVTPYRDPAHPLPEPPEPLPTGPRPLNRRGRPEPPPFETFPAPSLSLYLRHREWEALLGAVAAYAALVLRGYFL
jgi:hypothetical protein